MPQRTEPRRMWAFPPLSSPPLAPPTTSSVQGCWLSWSPLQQPQRASLWKGHPRGLRELLSPSWYSRVLLGATVWPLAYWGPDPKAFEAGGKDLIDLNVLWTRPQKDARSHFQTPLWI